MMKHILAALAVLCLAGTAHAAPSMIPWEFTTYTVVNADTLARGTTGAVDDTAAFLTAAIPIFGARAFVIEAFGDTLNPTTGIWSVTTDTLTTPGVLWDVSGTDSYAPLANGTSQTGVYAVPTGGLNLTTSGGVVATYYSSMDATAGGTPVPITMRNMKLRIVNNTQRFKGYTNAQVLLVNGPAYNKVRRLTVRVHVLR